MRRHIWFVIVIAGLLAGACGPNLEKAVVGKYVAEIDSSNMKGEEKAQAEMMAAFMKGITMELKEDKTAVMSAMGQTKSGTWKLEDKKVVVTVEGEKDPGVFFVEDGGETLVADAESMEMGDMKGARLLFKKDKGGSTSDAPKEPAEPKASVDDKGDSEEKPADTGGDSGESK
jgi:hypothetical protein